jgi:endonuclease YncB( thermonuclease family)
MRHFSFGLVAACLTVSSALAEPIAYTPPETVDGASIIIIDGDTVGLPSRERIRILEIDTPETFDSRCENELILGLKAKERLAELLRSGDDRAPRPRPLPSHARLPPAGRRPPGR